MTKRGFWVLALAFFLIPLVSAQMRLNSFGSIISSLINNDFVIFLILLGIFSSAFVISLSKIFPKAYANIIGILAAFLMTSAMIYTKVIDTSKIYFIGSLGLWTLALLSIIILIVLISLITPKEKIGWQQIVIALVIMVLAYLLFSGTIHISSFSWNFLYFIIFILAIIGLIWLLSRMFSASTGGAGGGVGGGTNFSWLGAPFKWLGNALKGLGNLAGKGIKGAIKKTNEIIERVGNVTVVINSPKAGQRFRRNEEIIIDADITGETGRYQSTIRILKGIRIYEKVPSGPKLYVSIGTPDQLNLADGTHYLEIDTYEVRFAQIPGHMKVRVPIEIGEGGLGPRGGKPGEEKEISPEGYPIEEEKELQVKIISPKEGSRITLNRPFDVNVAIMGGQLYHTLGIGVSGKRKGTYIHPLEHVGDGRITRTVTIKPEHLDESNEYSLIAVVKDKDGTEKSDMIRIFVTEQKTPQTLSVKILDPVPGQIFPKTATKVIPFKFNTIGGTPNYFCELYLNEESIYTWVEVTKNKIREFRIPVDQVDRALAKSKDKRRHEFIIEITDNEKNKATDSVNFIYDVSKKEEGRGPLVPVPKIKELQELQNDLRYYSGVLGNLAVSLSSTAGGLLTEAIRRAGVEKRNLGPVGKELRKAIPSLHKLGRDLYYASRKSSTTSIMDFVTGITKLVGDIKRGIDNIRKQIPLDTKRFENQRASIISGALNVKGLIEESIVGTGLSEGLSMADLSKYIRERKIAQREKK